MFIVDFCQAPLIGNTALPLNNNPFLAVSPLAASGDIDKFDVQVNACTLRMFVIALERLLFHS